MSQFGINKVSLSVCLLVVNADEFLLIDHPKYYSLPSLFFQICHQKVHKYVNHRVLVPARVNMGVVAVV